MSSKISGKMINFTLSNVMYVPKLASNLFSIGYASKHGISAYFKNDCCVVKKSNETLALGTRVSGGLYKLNIRPEKQQALLIKLKRTSNQWHKALGHPSQERIKNLEKQGLIEIDDKHDDEIIDCVTCPAGKGKRVNHPLKEEKGEQIGRRVHLDLSGKIEKDMFGYCYFLICKDECSSFCFTYFLKGKDEVWKSVKQLIIDFELVSSTRIQEIQTDCGSEFLNETVSLILLKEGIGHSKTAPYTPAQNGLIEREIQTVVNMARTMMIASCLKNIWSEAVRAATYIRNRLPTKRRELTPFEVLTNKKPVLSNIFEWGQPVQVINNVNYLTKFDNRTVDGFLVGYTNRRNTYRILLKENNKLIESSDIIFRKHASDKPLGNQVSEKLVTRDVQLNLDDNNKYTNDTIVSDTNEQSNNTVLHEMREQNVKRTVQGQELDDFFSTYLDTQNIGVNEADNLRSNTEALERVINNNESLIQEAENTINEASLVCTQDIRENEADNLRSNTEAFEEVINNNENVIQEAEDTINEASLVCAQNNNINDDFIPNNYEEAINCKNNAKWKEAIKSEIRSLYENKTWEIVEKPKEAQTLSAKWVFNIKHNIDGSIDRYKARLVARGFTQRPGIDFLETFAPVTSITSVRTMLAICVNRGWSLERFDVTTAFLNGCIEETLLMSAPEGIKINNNECLKLNKALYGLKQAPNAWHKRFDTIMEQLGFNHLKSDPCIYANTKKDVIVSIYVDDGLIISKEREYATQVIKDLNKYFETKQVYGKFLGMEIIVKKNEISINQEQYAEKIVKRFNLQSATGVTSPLLNSKALVNMELNKEDQLSDDPYREAIGAIQYYANCSRPDLLYAVNMLARFSTRPRKAHWLAVERIIKYINNTKKYGLTYKRNESKLEAYTDASWGGDYLERCSTSGGLILLSGGPISFYSRKQATIALSTAESEYLAACELVKELVATINLLNEIRYYINKPTVYLDNQSTLKQITGNETLRRSKHIDIKLHYIKEIYKRSIFSLEYINSNNQLADILTKELPGSTIKRICEKLNIRDVNRDEILSSDTKCSGSKCNNN